MASFGRLLPILIQKIKVKHLTKLSNRNITIHVGALQQFNVPKTSDADTFGHYSEEVATDLVPEDAEDVQELERAKEENRVSYEEYTQLMRTQLAKGNYEEAKSIFFDRMIKTDRIKPTTYFYNILLYFLAKTGNLKESFKLYNDLKRRGVRTTGAVYTSMFNCCANCKDSRYALQIADKLSDYLIKDKKHEVNIVNYNALLKAYGRHGALKKCFSIVDQVVEQRGRVRDDTYNFLLQSCVTDKNAGFRHALLIWHRMLQNKTRPSIYSFNLLLRVIRDCSVGEKQHFTGVIETIIGEGQTRHLGKASEPFHKLSNKQQELFKKKGSLPSQNNQGLPADDTHSDVVVSSLEENKKLPNLLSINPTSGSVVAFNDINSTYSRLLLVGGVTGFLRVMDEFGVLPNEKTLTLLLDLIPNTLETEEMLLSYVKHYHVQVDVTFFNMIIRRRALRYDYEAARDILQLLQDYKLAPDLLTFGVLALTCKTKEEAETLVENARSAGFRMNSEILGTLLRTATRCRDFPFINTVLRIAKQEEIQPNPKFYQTLESFVRSEKKLLNETENTDKISTFHQKQDRTDQCRTDTVEKDEDGEEEEEEEEMEEKKKEDDKVI